MPLQPEATAFLFPGQGSQTVGMGRRLAEADPLAAETFAEADDILGYPLSRLCWDGPAEELNDTQHTQPALLTHSVAVLRAFQQRFPDFRPAWVAGHSLGEFTALVAAGSLAFPDALRLVRERGLAMKEAGEKNPGGMAAVLGLDIEAVRQVCEEVTRGPDHGVWVANDNCPGQVVISGHQAALREAVERLEVRGARRVVRLAVSIAAHSPLMQAAQARFLQALEAAPIQDPQIPVMGNVGAAPLRTGPEVLADLRAQLTATVRWRESVENLVQAGVTTFVELGPGTVLTGLVRRIERQAACYNLDTVESLEALPL